MKGKNTFTQAEIEELRSLIKKRIYADRNKQKSIRARMRKIGFYGEADFGIKDLQPEDFEHLIRNSRIIITGETPTSNRQLSKPSFPRNILKMDILTKGRKIDIERFKSFNPLTDSEEVIPNAPGNYLIRLRVNSKLPDIGIQFITKRIQGLEVIYTGIAGRSLRTRDFRQHFTGNNAG